MADYPSTLPLPEGSQYEFEFGSQVIRSDMDDGLARQRRRYTSHVDKFAVSVYLDDVQLEEFERFVREDIGGGAAWFMMPLRDGQGVRDMEVRIIEGRYNIQKMGLKWNVTFDIDVNNRN